MSSLDHFRRLPKVELHLHLEGAIPIGCLWELVKKYGGHPDVPTVDALQAKFAYRNFEHFIETWVWKNQFLREYEDFSMIAGEVARDLVSQNILYAEAFYSPGDFRRAGLDAQRISEAIRLGLDLVPEIDVALVTDLIRDHGPEQGMRTLEAMAEIKDEFGIVGIGIGGSEQLFPPEPFAPVYEQAREFGFRTSAHAGEACGPETVWGAVHSLRPDRIGHGTRAIEDTALVDYLAEHRIPIEACVISNLRTGVVASVSEHPVRTYFDRGIPLSINTDDPKLFNTSLADEYEALHNQLGFSIGEIGLLLEQAIESAWLADERKSRLRERLRSGIVTASGG